MGHTLPDDFVTPPSVRAEMLAEPQKDELKPDMFRKTSVWFDLDSTLADTSGRWELLGGAEGKVTDWEDYAMACMTDKPFAGAVALLRRFHMDGYHIVICSGRSDQARELTEKWLDQNGIPFDELLLTTPEERNTVNWEQDAAAELKANRVHKRMAEDLNVVLFVDDDPTLKKFIHPAIPVVILDNYATERWSTRNKADA